MQKLSLFLCMFFMLLSVSAENIKGKISKDGKIFKITTSDSTVYAIDKKLAKKVKKLVGKTVNLTEVKLKDDVVKKFKKAVAVKNTEEKKGKKKKSKKKDKPEESESTEEKEKKKSKKNKKKDKSTDEVETVEEVTDEVETVEEATEEVETVEAPEEEAEDNSVVDDLF